MWRVLTQAMPRRGAACRLMPARTAASARLKTGLDPASRATLWGAIKRAKARRAVVLTTHAMAEAEELCDRIGVLVHGALRCVGAPRELTARYGATLVLTLSLASTGRAADADAFVRAALSPSAERTYGGGSGDDGGGGGRTLKYHLPLVDVDLPTAFEALSAAPPALGVVDWSVASMTLEEVFIRLARDAGVDDDSHVAAGEG